MKLLADTSALLALVMRRDQNHRAAAEFVQANPQARFVITELILAELVTRVRVHADAKIAVSVARNLLASRRYQILFVDAELLGGALEQMARFADKQLSLTDCVSFEVMARLGLQSAFTFDEDFRDCGLKMVPV